MDIFRRRYALHGPPDGESLSELFHENTKFQRAVSGTPDGQENYGVRELEAMARAYKRYPRHPQVALPPIQTIGPSFSEVIAARRTRRNFAARPLALAEVSAILQWSYGITGRAPIDGGGVQPFRAAPSAGALYPAEIYLAASAVAGLAPGIYHFEVPSASLAVLECGHFAERLCAICCGQEHARAAPLVVLISAVMQRTKRKYGERGYRYVLLDVGHLAQNLYLTCTALDLAIMTTCGFFDDEAADLLGIDGCEEAVVYVAFIGASGER
jgi:SagB-type dehydrogenase family enzyme